MGQTCFAPVKKREGSVSAVSKIKSVAMPRDLYGIGEIPPLGHVPEKMHAWVIRKERHGPPDRALQGRLELLQPAPHRHLLRPRRRGEVAGQQVATRAP